MTQVLYMKKKLSQTIHTSALFLQYSYQLYLTRLTLDLFQNQVQMQIFFSLDVSKYLLEIRFDFQQLTDSSMLEYKTILYYNWVYIFCLFWDQSDHSIDLASYHLSFQQSNLL